MVFEVQIDVSKALAALDKINPAAVAQKRDAALDESMEYLKREIQAGMPVDQGLGRGSIFTAHRGEGVGVVGSPLIHVLVMEEGRRPGATPPPVGPIQGWLSRHGMDAKLAFAVARAIGRRGMKARHMFRNAGEHGKPTIMAIFGRHFRL